MSKPLRLAALALSLSACKAPSLIETDCTPEQASFLKGMKNILGEVLSPFPEVNKDLQSRSIGEEEGIGCAKPNPDRVQDAAGTYTRYRNQILVNVDSLTTEDCEGFQGESFTSMAFTNGKNGYAPHHLKVDTPWYGDCYSLIVTTGDTLIHESAHAVWDTDHSAELNDLHEKEYSDKLSDEERARIKKLKSQDPTYQAGERWASLAESHWFMYESVGEAIGKLQSESYGECRDTCEGELEEVLEKFIADSDVAMRSQLEECGEMEVESDEEECRNQVDTLNEITNDLYNYGRHNLDDVCRDLCITDQTP